ncbi:peptide-N4-(N-acetyl-beta-glucosaminyl)asparagine amidase Ecym_7068 [Eremothecium cymbalariae DBVPG|uniref:Peptide-N(4)-(N-acetyl-beta-glucosaminyl)asparagine amidase n=1 Tax=Eremothecium cymbalariae (strain CBS 270.75 / DBVPG 7215 / KCTC 17166 / NRRL Y-17582) TaxID=931890 RepID=G8JVQ6_ERECY|nr:hypothetical protein Ecym_7068 [Eremothecium cymbalariae DBVPG\
MNVDEIYSNVSRKLLNAYRIIVLKKSKQFCPGEDLRYRTLLSTNAFARKLDSLRKSLCYRYDNENWHAQVFDALNLELIYQNVDSSGVGSTASEDYEDRLVKELLRYFKEDFFTWCDRPKCTVCDSVEFQRAVGQGMPNQDEAQYECGVVELYHCDKCGGVTRFPRYNDPIKLLETRTGRCGEWCNLFTLVLKSFGIETRYIWNKEDHVWCEVYSNYLKRWVHVDSCEKSFDEPFIYSINWNKSMSYVIAFSCDSVKDVSNRYILKNQLVRDQINEDDLHFLLDYMTKTFRKSLSDEYVYLLSCRDELEDIELLKTGLPSSTTSAAVGRESGSTQWKKQRGEDGN